MFLKGVLEVENAKITKWSGYDFCLYRNVSLYVTDRAFNVLKERGTMKNFSVLKWNLICNMVNSLIA